MEELPDLDSKESACNAEDPGSIPGLGRFPGEGNGYPLQYSCLEDSMDRGAWWATVHGVTKSRTHSRSLERKKKIHYMYKFLVKLKSLNKGWELPSFYK